MTAARLRRSELSTPATSERMIASAAASSADLVFLDLEDSVAPAEKKAARAKVAEALMGHDWGTRDTSALLPVLEAANGYRDGTSARLDAEREPQSA